MDTQDNTRKPASVYIPPTYRGNALYFEQLGREEEQAPCEEKKESPESPCTACEHREGRGLSGILSGLFDSDNGIIIAVALFLLFCSKNKKDGQSDDMLTVLLLFLLLV